MLKFGNKEFRNLEEQVDKNKQDIADLTAGISAAIGYMPTILGVYATFAEIPTGGYNTGDTFLIGNGTPYSVYVYTDKNQWVNVGQFPVAGPKGDKGDLGSVITAAAGGPQVTPESLNDFYIDTITGDWYVASRTVSGSLVYIKSFSLKGEKGDRGEKGLAGSMGPMGPTGPLGERGLTGLKGDQGQKGDTGATGPAGNSVTNMSTASFTQDTSDPTIFHNAIDVAYSDGTSTTFTIDTKGIKGDKGDTGATGATGAVGPTGPRGLQGELGPKGDTGEQGILGILGPQGLQGIQGPQGPTGNGVEDLISVRDIGAPVVTYDIQDGITVNTTDQYTYGTDNKTFDVSTEREIPIIAGKGISMDANTTSDKVIIKVDDEQLATKSDLIDTALKLQPRLTAGEGINIDNNTNTISVTELDTGIKEINIGVLPNAGESITLSQAAIDEIFAQTCTLVDNLGHKYIELDYNTGANYKVFASILTATNDTEVINGILMNTGNPVKATYLTISDFGCIKVTKNTLTLKNVAKIGRDKFYSGRYYENKYLQRRDPDPVTYSQTSITPAPYKNYAKIAKTNPVNINDYSSILNVVPIVTKQNVLDLSGVVIPLGTKSIAQSIICALGEFKAVNNIPAINSIILGSTDLNKEKKINKLYINFNKIYKLPELDPVINEISSDYEISCNRELDKINFTNTLPEGQLINDAEYIVKSVYNSDTDSNTDYYYKFPKFEPTTEQQAALDSGITADKVTTYDGYQAAITEAKTQADKGVSDAAAAKAVADAALPTTTFEAFLTTNTTAIADAKKAGTDAQAELTTYKASNDEAISNLNSKLSNKVSKTGTSSIEGILDFVYGLDYYINKRISPYIPNNNGSIIALEDQQSSKTYNILSAEIDVNDAAATIKDKYLYLGADDEYDLKFKGKSRSPYYKKSGDTEYKQLALEPEVITIYSDAETSGTTGVLPADSINILKACDDNYIILNSKEYYLFDKFKTEGYLTYSNVSIENDIHYIKTIRINTNAGVWTLTTSDTNKTKYKHRVTILHQEAPGGKDYNGYIEVFNDNDTPLTIDTIPDGSYPFTQVGTTGLSGLYNFTVATADTTKSFTCSHYRPMSTGSEFALQPTSYTAQLSDNTTSVQEDVITAF